MPYCRFFKVDERTTWNSIYKKSQLHEQMQKKELQYRALTTIKLSDQQFNSICNSIYSSHQIYRKFSAMSVAGFDGVWNCIVLSTEDEKRKLIIYTAGEISPLYVGIN